MDAIVHVSVGSAAKGVHFSTDIDMDDAAFDERLTKFFEWQRKAELFFEKMSKGQVEP